MSIDIVAATISDSNNNVTTYPASIKSRSLKDGLFSFTTSGTAKTDANTVNNTVRTIDGTDYFLWSMRDEKGNFVGFACTESNDEVDYDRDGLLKDLLLLAHVSSLGGNDATIRPRIVKLLEQRVTAKVEAEEGNANDSIEVMRRVLEKRAASASPVRASPAASASASPSPKKKPEKKEKKVVPTEIVSSEEPAAASKEIDGTSTKHHHSHSYHDEEFEKEFKTFQGTAQYKASIAILALSGIVSLVFFVCNPTLSACH